MKKLLNTLYVSTQGTYLAKEGQTVAVRVEGRTVANLPAHTLSGVVCFGNVGLSPFLMGFLAESGVAVSMCRESGRFLARVSGPVAGNVLIRRAQYRLADDRAASAQLARAIVTAKIVNARTLIRRALKDHAEKVDARALGEAARRLGASLEELDRVTDLDVLRGLEGEASRTYFSVFDHLIVNQKKDFNFTQRSRRPPLDRVNCLLSFYYTLLYHDARSALETVGLDPAVGFLHRDRPGRYSLALDLMEELRPYIADRLALSLINLGQVKRGSFTRLENQAVLMKDKTRKEVITAYQKRKQDEITHPFIEEKIPIGLLFHVQAMLLARCIRGDLDGYPPFMTR